MSIYRAAAQTARFDDNYGGRYVAGPWRGVLHTTETTGLPGYSSGKTAPHFTVDPERQRTWQHYDTDRPARALRHPGGTVDTNNLHCIQIEIVAYSDEAIAKRVGGLPVSGLTGDHLAYIAQLMRWIETQHGVKPTDHGLRWARYPGHCDRMSTAEWRAFDGWCGHQHVPNNTHGDPSNINIEALLGDDMPDASDIGREVAKALQASGVSAAKDTVAAFLAAPVAPGAADSPGTVAGALYRTQSELMRLSDLVADSAELSYAIARGDQVAQDKAIARIRARDITHPGETA